MSESPPTPSASILLVDDDPANVVALKAILAPLGYAVLAASSGEEALRQILQHDVALIFIDAQMAGLYGFETANLLKQGPRGRTIPLIFTTDAKGEEGDVFRAYSLGAVAYLFKPFDPDILRSKVRVFVDLYLKEELLNAEATQLRARERDALLRAGEERYRHLLDVMPQSIWASDAQGRITFWNRAVVEYLGHEPGVVTGESLWSALHPDDRASVREGFEQEFARQEAFERQIRLRRASDGTYRWHLARVVPERGSDGEGAITGWIATATDIDDQKKAEQLLREAIGLREDFLSVASHELRTPLTSLRLEVENLLRFARRSAGEAAGPIIQRAERIDAQAARLNHLIDELLDVSRIAAGRLELQIEEVDLMTVVDEVRTRLGDEARRRGCALDVRGQQRAVGAWDASRLDQVITNLLSNAIKYGAGKPIEITVDVTGDRAVLAIHDHGLGISAEDQDRIFRRFERAASSRNYAGIGLGLWIVKHIVEALGGTVRVDSRPELGATFTVELPRTRPPTITPRGTVAPARAEARRGAN